MSCLQNELLLESIFEEVQVNCIKSKIHSNRMNGDHTKEKKSFYCNKYNKKLIYPI